MENLNRTAWLFFFCVCFNFITATAQPSIDIKELKRFILADSSTMVPRDYVTNLDDKLFGFRYCDDLCFVHIGYKGYSSECTMKTSLVVILQLVKDRWIFKKVVPFYYNFSLLDCKQLVFLSKNRFCEPNGTCNSFTALCQFNRNTYDFIDLKSYLGFDRYLRLYFLLAQGKQSEIQKAMGDTITSEYDLKDFLFNSGKNGSFILNRRMVVLKALEQDSLITEIIDSHINVSLKK